MENPIKIASYENIFEAELAATYLGQNGIETRLINERMISMMPGLAGLKISIDMEVPLAKAEEAKELLDAVDQLKLEELIFGKELDFEDDDDGEDEEDDDEDEDWEEQAWEDEDFEGTDSVEKYEWMKDSNVILEGHFQLTSGLHSNKYVEKMRILQNTAMATGFCQELSDLLEDFEFDCVVGPAYGGIALAFEVATYLDSKFIFCQRIDGVMSIRSGFDLTGIKKAAIIEDIVTTGGSVKEVIECLKAKGIETVVVAAIVDRSDAKADFGVSFISLVDLFIPTWEPKDCPLCQAGIPILKPGSSDKLNKA